MSLLLPELIERLLQQYDSDTLLEMLEITAEELLENFQDRVAERREYLLEQLDGEEDEATEV